MIVLTGNDLKTGDVVWWDGAGWSADVNTAVDVGQEADTIALREDAACRVNVPYAIKAEHTSDGVRPAHIKDRIRALGPTVRMDLTRRPDDAGAQDWVI
ncbi:DUF2849 domain-containing protein [Croceicoccus sp. F390]|uniref:DUF2849 domain-containing protein n=1 Tax=Croceicoccus esteveae TaxID=3075597 RepID=A0ABU2ZGB7_9SPHN|nr:DUF2849 domain-containing protein [Croceicoccus sp. F390]MDT0575635.1 DUF2849 domain-containing protein [Croceicoccus sp. F390]